MNNKSYHHGDLRTALIERGIEVIDQKGIEALSLRKLAAACGVSEAAPYGHFANKDDLINSIEHYVSNKLSTALKESVKETGVTMEGLVELGCAFVMFFVRNPQYFDLIYSHLNISAGGENRYEPYDFIVSFMQKLFENIGHPPELRELTFVAQFSFIQGLMMSSIMIKNHDAAAKEGAVRKLLSANHLLFIKNN
ncbi:MAG: TetR/AcrR family transcriptional regulator [Defluviitaleaceae bacterium]|nr:TetR/AcrR family transcriptional regulator [Defluviitaleaceae bacterium]